MFKNGFLIIITSVAALGGLMFGYDTGIINGTQFFFTKYFELDSFMQGWVVSSALLGCLVGAMSSGYVNNSYGRKYSLILSALLFTISAWGSGLPSFMGESVSLLVFFRIIGGVGIGIASMTAPTYIAEIAPPDKRGLLVSFYQLAIVLGFFVVFLATYYIGKQFNDQENINEGWRWMFWSELIPCFLFLGLTFIIPRSPRWLMMKNQHEEAFTILSTLRGEKAATKEYSEIVSSLEKETVEAEKSPTVHIAQKAVLPIVLIGTILSLLQQFTGINAVLYYGGDIFEKALGYGKEDVLAQQILLGAVNLIFTFVAMYLVDRLGRKPLLLIGSYGMLLGFILLGGSLYFNEVGIISLIGVLVFIGSFAMSMGPITWVMLSEMFPNCIRSVAMSIAVAVQWGGNALVTFLFPIMADSQVNKEYWNNSLPYVVYGFCIFILILFVNKYIIETKNKTLEELESIWAEKYGKIEK